MVSRGRRSEVMMVRMVRMRVCILEVCLLVCMSVDEIGVAKGVWNLKDCKGKG